MYYEWRGALGAALRTAGPTAAPPPWPELLAHPAVLCTPHNAFNTAEALVRKCDFAVQRCRAFLEKQAIPLAAASMNPCAWDKVWTPVHRRPMLAPFTKGR